MHADRFLEGNKTMAIDSLEKSAVSNGALILATTFDVPFHLCLE
jgi:hypothetical protein